VLHLCLEGCHRILSQDISRRDMSLSINLSLPFDLSLHVCSSLGFVILSLPFCLVSPPLCCGYCATSQGSLDWFEVDLRTHPVSSFRVMSCIVIISTYLYAHSHTPTPILSPFHFLSPSFTSSLPLFPLTPLSVLLAWRTWMVSRESTKLVESALHL